MSRPRRTPGTAFAMAALTALLALGGCTSTGSSDAGSSAPGTGSLETAITPIPASDVSTPTSTAPAPSTSPAPSPSLSRTPSRTASVSAPPPPGPPACTSARLKIRALRGSAAAGQEFALLTFTNTAASACTMFGFPGVSLRLNNALLGKPAGRARITPRTVTLKAGQQAEATITDFSSCQAPVSDTVRVYAPNQRAFVDLPLALRACQVVVDPVTHS